jgi:anti-sigma-K factor RskA
MAVMSDSQQERMSERNDIEALLPWYLTGKLDTRSRARVERYIEAHPEIRAQLALVDQESDATIVANEMIPTPGTHALERLRASLAVAPRPKPALAQLSERISDWIAGLAQPQLAWAAAAAALVVTLQAATIGVLLSERVTAPTYQTASDENIAGSGIELLVGFSETATIGEISATLNQLDAVLVDGPRGGLYRLRLPDQDNGREAAIDSLKESGLVTVILPKR